jgi:hypothetical protein
VKRRYDYLAIGTICLLLALLVIAEIARAETTAYVTLHSPGAGYDLGAGLRIEHTSARWNRLAVYGMARAAWQEKHGADQGYTAGAIAQARAYVYRDVYLAAGYGVSRYRSEFEDGVVWAKQSWQPHAQVGWDGPLLNLWCAYYFEEHDTPNRVEAIKIGGAVPVWDRMQLMIEVSRMEFWQSGQRMNDVLTTMGFGWKF